MEISLEKPGDHLYRQHMCASCFFLLVSAVLRDVIDFCSTSLAPLNRLNYMIILNKLYDVGLMRSLSARHLKTLQRFGGVWRPVGP